MLKKATIIGIAWMLCVSQNGYAQAGDLKESGSQNIDVPVEEDTWGIFPLVAPIYEPETRWAVAGGGIFWYNPTPKAAKKRISEYITFFKASQNAQYEFGLISESYFLEQKLKVMHKLEAYKQPNLFWGLGPNSSNGQKTTYDPTGAANRISFLWLTSENLYIGPLWYSHFDSITYSNGDQTARNDKSADYGIPGRNETAVNGPGAHLVYDSRDNPFFPHNGHWMEAQVTYSEPGLGARGRFVQIMLDYRRYISPWLDHVVGVNYIFTSTVGDVPWAAMPKFGGQFQMRGYFEGRYIDRNLWTVQVDYRIPVYWRFGLVFFSGLGDVNSDWFDPLWTTPKFSFGGGLRFTIDKDEGINMRYDIGVSVQGEVNQYFTFKEAF